MLKKNWCLIILVVLIVVGGVLFYRWYRYYHYSPIEGHTETTDGSRSGDDYYQCFAESEKNAVVLHVNFSGIDDKHVALVDLNYMGDVDPSKPGSPVIGKVLDPAKEIQIRTEDEGGKTKITIRDAGIHVHLGPGPYMVVAVLPGASAEDKPRGTYEKRFYYYQTYNKRDHGPDQCASYHQ